MYIKNDFFKRRSCRDMIGPFIFFIFLPLSAQGNSTPLVRWIKGNFTSYNLPLSFSILPENKTAVWESIGGRTNADSMVERVIVDEGLIIYDGAVAQIAMTKYGMLDSVARVFKTYWTGSFGEFRTIRGGYNGTGAQPFIYLPDHPDSVSANIADFGKRGYIFKIIDAKGKYNTTDPWSGASTIWQDWKPISGENAWAVIAAGHYLYKKYYDSAARVFTVPDTSSVLKLAKEIARCAMFLQADNGGIRMGPIGTFHPQGNSFYYYEISTENNASWYSAFSMLFKITGEAKYGEARDRIASYIKWAYNASDSCFSQGAHFDGAQWQRNNDFAFDCQSWVILSLGADSLDAWLGPGTTYRALQTGFRHSGYFSGDTLEGVGYSDEHDQVSVEWSAGAILASRSLSKYYHASQPAYSAKCSTDARQMIEGLNKPAFGLRTEIGDQSAYSYSLTRKFIPFGWWSHSKSVLSTASTGWMVFVNDSINPFAFIAKKERYDLIGAWSGQGVYYRNSDNGAWVKLGSPADLIATGDLDGDGIDDLIGIWPGQGGVWVKYSKTGDWAKLASTARHIAAGDINGDGRVDLVGTWDGQGTYYRNSITGAWVKLGSPATLLTTGDLDGDGTDDLIGIWPSQGGVWVKYSHNGAWAQLSSTALDIATGDMNGDGRADFLGTWSEQGTYYRNSVTGAWVKLGSEATQVTAGDLDADGTDDLIGIRPSQGGVWAKYSKTGAWEKLSSTAIDIATGKMRGGATPDIGSGPMLTNGSADESAQGPGGTAFKPIAEADPMPR
jgi:hypothetical protein